MSDLFAKYIDQLHPQIDGSKLEKNDICEEIMIHLELTRDEYIAAGYDHKEAEHQTLAQFDTDSNVGKQMQEAMFPLRKLLLILLAFLSLLHTYSTYIASLIIESDAHIGWLLLSVVSSSFLLIFAYQILPSLNQKRWLNSIFIFHALLYLYGALISSSMQHIISIPTSILAYFIIAFAILFIFRTTIYDFQYKQTPVRKQLTFLHVWNISLGIIYVGLSLFFFVVFSIFAESFELILLLPLLFILFWGLMYAAQIKLMAHQKKIIAYLIMIVPTLCLGIILIWIYLPDIIN